MKIRALALLFVMVATVMLMPVAEAGRGHGGRWNDDRGWRDCNRNVSRWDRNRGWGNRRVSWNNRRDRDWNRRWDRGPRGRAYGYYANSPRFQRVSYNRYNNSWW